MEERLKMQDLYKSPRCTVAVKAVDAHHETEPLSVLVAWGFVSMCKIINSLNGGKVENARPIKEPSL